MPALAYQEVRELGSEMLQFAGGVEDFDTPQDVLNGLDEAASHVGQLHVLGAALLPARCGDWNSVEKGKTAFIHKSVPTAWWDEHIEQRESILAPLSRSRDCRSPRSRCQN
jgi:hypothetical protein